METHCMGTGKMWLVHAPASDARISALSL